VWPSSAAARWQAPSVSRFLGRSTPRRRQSTPGTRPSGRFTVTLPVTQAVPNARARPHGRRRVRRKIEPRSAAVLGRSKVASSERVAYPLRRRYGGQSAPGARPSGRFTVMLPAAQASPNARARHSRRRHARRKMGRPGVPPPSALSWVTFPKLQSNSERVPSAQLASSVKSAKSVVKPSFPSRPFVDVFVPFAISLVASYFRRCVQRPDQCHSPAGRR